MKHSQMKFSVVLAGPPCSAVSNPMPPARTPEAERLLHEKMSSFFNWLLLKSSSVLKQMTPFAVPTFCFGRCEDVCSDSIIDSCAFSVVLSCLWWALSSFA